MQPFGKYLLLEKLHVGGMAEVYKGRHPTLNRVVAIKVLVADRATESDFRVRFEREAKAVAMLRHPNIVQVYDSGDIEGMYYMVMEYIEGGSLSDYIVKNKALLIEDALSFLADVAGALDYAHEQGLVHRDIKP